MEAFAALGIAANIAQFVDYGARFIKLAQNVRNGVFDETGLLEIEQYVSTITFIRSTLDVKALLALATTCQKDAQTVVHSFKTLLPTHHATGPTSDRKSKRASTKLSIKNVYHRDHTQPPASYSIRSAFLLLWKKREIEEVFKRLDWYRAELNLRTVAVINLKADDLLHGMKLLRSQNENLADQANRQGKDIVEVVSINKSMLSTVESLAAILTRRNGETFTVPCETGIPSSIYKEPDVSSIKYALEETDELAAAGDLIKGNGSAFILRILNALHFREEDDRQETVAEAHQRTFQWIFDIHSIDDTFDDLAEWLEFGRGCYWINGKAGSGKSTLMKYIYQQPRTYQLLAQWSKSHRSKHLNPIIASFFFWNSGSELQKSYEGMFRSLLVQIMSKRPDLVPILFPALSRHLLSKPSPNLHISLTELKAAFSKLTKVIDENTKLFILIDGVDEFAGDHLEISKLLSKVSKTEDIKILLSSRPIPACFQVFSQCPTLQVQDLTEGDILNYIEDELISNELMQEKEMLEEGFSDTILNSLTEKAAGVFLWIVLVVNDLLMGLANYDSKEDLMKRIDKLPSDLEKLYDHLFTSLDAQYRAQASLLFQLVMRSVQVQKAHLTVLQLQFAEASSPDRLIPDDMFTFPPEMEAVMIKTMEGRLRSRCRGLLESQQNRKSHQRDPWVTFLHRTVQDYLKDDSVWERVTESNPISLDELDELLIASCIREMKQRRPETDNVENWRAALDFESCLEYSSEVARRGENFHEAYCESALTILTRYCHAIDPTAKAKTRRKHEHSELLERWACHRLSTYDGFKRTSQPELLKSCLASTMLFAYEKLPSLFTQRVRSLGYSKDEKALILHEFCYMASHRSAGVWHAAECAKIILDAGFDPNHPMPSSIKAGTTLSSNLLESTGVGNSRRSIPWVFWQECVGFLTTITITHLEITLQLIRAGAELKVESNVQARFTAAFVSRLFQHCSLGDDVSRTLLEQIQQAFEANGYNISNKVCTPTDESVKSPFSLQNSQIPQKTRNRFSLLRLFRSDVGKSEKGRGTS